MLDRLIGNDEIKATVRRLVSGSRVPQSLLFAGPDGVGKRQFALEIARAMLCQSPAGADACGECAICKRTTEWNIPDRSDGDRDAFKRVFFSSHADVGMILPYKNNILVDAIRDLESEANFRPFEANHRFFIIDDADKMNDAASNALLKTLEEPSSSTFLMLITANPAALLPTILSRCQTLRFSPIDKVRLAEFLQAEHSFSHEDALIAAAVSKGGIGRALTLDIERTRAIRERMLNVVENSARDQTISDLLKISEEMSEAKNKEFFESSLDILESLVRDVVALSASHQAWAVQHIDIAGRLQQIAEMVPPSRSIEWLDMIEHTRKRLAVNINRKPATDSLFVRMAANCAS